MRSSRVRSGQIASGRRLDPPQRDRLDHEVGAVVRVTLIHQTRDVDLHRAVGDAESGRNRLVAQTKGQGGKDLALARCEVGAHEARP